MVDIKYYTKLLINEETGKERYSLISKEAEKIYKNNSLEKCWDIAMVCICFAASGWLGLHNG
ncbi:MAG: hypothetical protein LBP36_03555 [Oscillospiraceae bacterium]|jgi:hypothetical protein|nr:hypothetical protein [Oscillospiraceae bacterium]